MTDLLAALERVVGHPLPPPRPRTAREIAADEAMWDQIDHAVASADDGWVSDDDAARWQAAYDNWIERESA